MNTAMQKRDAGALNSAQITMINQKTPPEYIEQRQGRGGKRFSYCPHTYVTSILNKAFCHNWDFYESDPLPELRFEWEERKVNGHKQEVITRHIEIGVKGRLVIHTPAGDIEKEQFGVDELLIINGKPNKRLTDVAKGAASDALRKCASLLGVALDLYGKGVPDDPDYILINTYEIEDADEIEDTYNQKAQESRKQPETHKQPANLDLAYKKREVLAAIGSLRGQYPGVKLQNGETPFGYFNRRLRTQEHTVQSLTDLHAEIYEYQKTGELKVV